MIEQVQIKNKLMLFLNKHNLFSDVEQKGIQFLKFNQVNSYVPITANLKLHYGDFDDSEEGKYLDF